jgi:hypothetical protein
MTPGNRHLAKTMIHKPVLFAAAALSCLAFPALADTRDDVLAAMQRCQAIPDDRTWLDCTYGAQQQMRAKLNLPPAPEFQQRLVPPAAGPYQANTSPYQASAGPSQTMPGKPAPLSRRKASFFQILTGTAQPLAISNLADVRYDSRGAFLLTLQNGQVWHQVDPDFSTKPRMKVGAKITISPGAMGSYNLKSDQDSHMYKVEPRS